MSGEERNKWSSSEYRKYSTRNLNQEQAENFHNTKTVLKISCFTMKSLNISLDTSQKVITVSNVSSYLNKEASSNSLLGEL
jgi:hypothetical protein